MQSHHYFIITTILWYSPLGIDSQIGTDGERPKIVRGPENLVVAKNDAALMNCIVSGQPKPTVKWFKDGKQVDINNNKMVVRPDGSLWFSKVKRTKKRSDEGVYYCVASNIWGSAKSGNATLTVTYMSKRFKLNPVNISVPAGREALLKCSPPEGNPHPVIEWKKGQRFLRTAGRLEIINVGDQDWLRISNVQKSDSGVYQCTAKNPSGVRDSAEAYLTVKVLPKVKVVPSSVEVYEGRSFDIQCQTSGEPPPMVHWDKLNGQLPPVNRLVTLSGSKIRIEKVEMSDKGVYVCRASNSEGSSSANVTVSVKMRPYFVTRPTHLSVGLGQTAVLECEVRGEPTLRLFWQKLNAPSTVETLIFPKQQYDGRLTVKENGMLQIRDVHKKDGATYVCTVVSGPVTIAASARVTVIDNGVPPPKVSVRPFNQTVMEGQNVTIMCLAEGSPRPSVTWEFGANNEPITPMTEGVILRQRDSEHTLTLKNVLKSDSGSYRCIASNAGGKQYKLAYVTVKVVPRAPSPPAYVDVLNITASTLVLRWKPPSNPVEAPVTSYIIEFIDVDDSKDWQVLVSGVRSAEFQVVNLKSDTRYMFYVRAVNKVGPSRPSPVSRIIRTKLSFIFPFTASTPAKRIDKLLNVKLQLSLQPDSQSSIGLSWKSVRPASRIKGFYIYWRKSGSKDYERVTLEENTRSAYTLRGLKADTEYEVSIQAFNDVYTSPMSDSETLRTMPEALNDAPEGLNAIDKGRGSMLVIWNPPKGIKVTDFLGYKVFCYNVNGKPVATGQTKANETSFLLRGLEPGKRYSVTVAARMTYGNGPGSRLYVTAGSTGALGPNLSAAENDANNKGKKQEGFIAILKAPWFIAVIGVVLWLILFSIVIFIIYRRRKAKKAGGYGEQSKGLLAGNRRTDVGINRNRNSYRDSSFLWTPPSTGNEVSDSSLGNGSPGRPMRSCYRSLNGKKEEDTLKSEFNPLLGRQETIEMKTAVRNGSLPKQAKNVNLRAVTEGSRTTPRETTLLNNEVGKRTLEMKPKQTVETSYGGEDERPRLKIQGAFDVTPLPQDIKDNRMVSESGKDGDKTNSSVRHAEIVRTATKKTFPDAELVNCMESNPLSTWKREKMKDAPQVLKEPGEDTLKRRAAKSPFKPLPKLEVLNWADSLPGPPSKPPSIAGSPPGSPKMMSSSASAFSENPGSRAPSRTSHGSSGSLNRFAHGPRSTHGQSVSSRRLSQSSSMLSSELYQSEMDPSVYSDAASEKKKAKQKVVPPPIDLDGLTSDILLQWAESVTNSSPSSSGSSSPSRLSGISSDGSFFTDEDFAQAVAAVVECGGFNMDFDYMPGVPPNLSNNRVSTDSYKRRKMDKIDAFIAHKSSKPSSRNGPPSNILSQYKSRPDAPSPAGVAAPISLSGYLPGGSKRSASGSTSSQVPSHALPSKVKFKQPKLDQPAGLRYGAPEVEPTILSGTPLTMSNLREHDSSLERDRKGSAKPLTVSNLRQHESSLERTKRQHNSSPLERVDSPLKEEDSIDQEIHGITNGLDHKRTPEVLMAKPLSITSALERNESVGSRDSRSSISEKGGKGTSERRRKKYVVNLKDPNSSTSTASTVRTSPDHTEC